MFLLSTLTSAGIAFAGAYCNSYGTLMVTRVLQAIAISPPQRSDPGVSCIQSKL